LLAWFNGFVAGRPHEIMSKWMMPWQIMTGLSVTSLVSLIVAIGTE